MTPTPEREDVVAALAEAREKNGPVKARMRRMFWAPTRRRHYATLKQACRAEAGAIIKREWGMEFDGLWNEDDEMRLRRDIMARELEDAYFAALRDAREGR